MARNKTPNDRDRADQPRRGNFSFDSLFSGLSGRASQTFVRAVGHSGTLLETLMKAPEYMEQIGRAGSYLKDMREVAGLTVDDLAQAVDIDNPELLRAIEEGRSPLTLDILYRLASFYSRNDPVTFMINFSREYAPWLWQVLRVTGIEKLLVTVERELKFINIYRSREAARHLSDENFDKMLGFVRGGFNMAMDFIEPEEEERRKKEKAAVTAKRQQRRSPQPATGTKSATGAKSGNQTTRAADTASPKPASASTRKSTSSASGGPKPRKTSAKKTTAAKTKTGATRRRKENP